ncbi:malate synthase G [Curvivirga aplysinae]|uniref:malate synthase G n=1 Tax=Curvivirga aplysinae TaxID=2529852 RepID=UPI0012BBF200|nr:malate synthase G [Curvivirga aplysinae]MTI09789.1 malate synthase G [Curvivirga aplysinae]
MTNRVQKGSLQIDAGLYGLVADKIIPGTGVDVDDFWAKFEATLNELAPKNKALLAKRGDIQTKMDDYYRDQKGNDIDMAAYKDFLTEIGYLVPEGDDFKITTENVDEEIATIAGPQLVVPIMNARFALNAANARWGSLYDALYGTDVIADSGETVKGGSYNPKRGDAVIAYAAAVLDKAAPLTSGQHGDVTSYNLVDNGGSLTLSVTLKDGSESGLKDAEKCVGYTGAANAPTSILLKDNNLHLEIQIDRDHPIGKSSAAGVKDVVMESAMSAIMDCEDSVAAVDGEDKVVAYRNWLGLMKGDLQETFSKNGKEMTRVLADDRSFTSVDGSDLSIHGRSLLLVRNVGHLMTNPAILDKDGNEVPEGMMDAFITTLCAIHNFNGNAKLNNSRKGSIYIVKPKMHGPEEVAFAEELFCHVEDALSLARNTMKIGVMDEERRTTVNLKECIRQVKDRIVFINTGFLDRTGDEIHTSMEAGPFLPKADIKGEAWIAAYENWNVDIGLEVGFTGKAQIGKGMWAEPDSMKAMMDAKIGQPMAGANCAWVPSPTAATLHAIHYHEVDVFGRQAEILNRGRANIDDILSVPLLKGRNLSDEEITRELENNAQGMLGYVVRWVEQGVGCSKVPDINNVGLMEDRATLRISSQHIANWLHHGICNEDQVMEVLKRMAKVVDGQNAGDPDYRPMAADFDNSVAFQAACDLTFKGVAQPSGYTEPVLHARRIEAKAKFAA